MDDVGPLVQETLRYLQETYGPNDFVLATPEEWEYFHMPQKKEILEPPKKPRQDAMDEIRNLVSKAAPGLALKKEIPDDALAKKIAAHWQEELTTTHVALLSFGETGLALQFLQNIAVAISSHFTCAKVVDGNRFEKEKKWPLLLESSPLKLILATSAWKATSLVPLYRQNLASSSQFLSKIPFIVLEPASHYFKNPSLKPVLWTTIVSHLSS